jgi:hypothetical protein
MIILLSKLIFAQTPEYTYLEVGEPAPFSGRLFNDAASELISETIDDNLAKCMLQTEYEIKKLQIEHNKQLHDLKNDYNMVILQKDAKIEKLNKDIEILTEIKTPPKPKFWFSIGAGTTAVVFGTLAYIIGAN